MRIVCSGVVHPKYHGKGLAVTRHPRGMRFDRLVLTLDRYLIGEYMDGNGNSRVLLNVCSGTVHQSRRGEGLEITTRPGICLLVTDVSVLIGNHLDRNG